MLRVTFENIFFFLLVSSCTESPEQDQTPLADSTGNEVEITAASVAGNFSDQTTLKVDSIQLHDFFSRYTELTPYQKNISSFYEGRDFAMAWHDGNGMIEQAGNLFNRLQVLPENETGKPVPYLSNLDSLLSSANTNDAQIQKETDMLFTGLYFYFAENVWAGIDEKKSRKIDWFLPRKKIDYTLWLDSLLKEPGGFAGSDEPVYRQYHLLKSFLDKYRSINTKEKWTPLQPGKKSYRPGDSSQFIGLLRERLALLGDIASNSGSNVFDSSLVIGVRNAQLRFGLKADGIVGPQFLAELNIPLEKRIQQIAVNLERSRWIPNEIKGDYLAVNIPEFRLHAYHDDSLLFDMKVVVGKSVHKTTIFSGELKYVVFSPYWNVPPGILKNEVLPAIKRDKNYLAKNHMEWNGNTVRQKPGPWNALGKVKFLFPNSYSIYLHDSPAKSLFNETTRAFSHGCIRVAEPAKLAKHLLRNEAGWTDQSIHQAMNATKEKYVTLSKPVPVFIAYFTAWVDRQGRLNFRKDIYDRDERLLKMIQPM